VSGFFISARVRDSAKAQNISLSTHSLPSTTTTADGGRSGDAHTIGWGAAVSAANKLKRGFHVATIATGMHRTVLVVPSLVVDYEVRVRASAHS
jgi:hypothetical protein